MALTLSRDHSDYAHGGCCTIRQLARTYPHCNRSGRTSFDFFDFLFCPLLFCPIALLFAFLLFLYGNIFFSVHVTIQNLEQN